MSLALHAQASEVVLSLALRNEKPLIDENAKRYSTEVCKTPMASSTLFPRALTRTSLPDENRKTIARLVSV